MPIATAPALLIGIGARILLDKVYRTDGPFIKDFILMGAWQGVALHYATKTSGTSGLGILVAFAIAAKLFIEFNLVSDVTRCVTTILGVALGVLFTDFLSQYFDKPPHVPSERRRKKTTTISTPQKRERDHDKRREKHTHVVPKTQPASTVMSGDVTDLQTLATNSLHISDITSVDSNSERLGPISSLSPLEREIHVLRTRAALADSERRRLKEERKWAISQGNMARASQMKWEVKRYAALMETFNREAELKALEASGLNGSSRRNNGAGAHSSSANGQKSVSSTPKDRSPKSRRETAANGNGQQTNGHSSLKPQRASNSKTSSPHVAKG